MKQYIWQKSDWPNFVWDNQKLLVPLGQCRLLQGKLLSTLSPSFSTEPMIQAEVLTQEALKTSAIEGEDLDIKSVRSSVARKLGLSYPKYQNDKKIDGLITVLFEATNEVDTPFTAERLFSWHRHLFSSARSEMQTIEVGKYRDIHIQVVSEKKGHEKIHFEGPPSAVIHKEMKIFFQWFKKSHGNIEGIIRAGISHFWFVTIHPFEDGNGRLARAITDMALAQDDKQTIRYYSMSAQIMREREKYYHILERSQKNSCDITEWLLWFIDSFSCSIEYSQEILRSVFAKTNFLKSHDTDTLLPRQKKVINKLLDLTNRFKGGLNTQKYASITKTSRATAFRDLDDLVARGIFIRIGQGRTARYELKW